MAPTCRSPIARSRCAGAAVAVALLASCGRAGDDSGARPAAAPLIGPADASPTDVADRDCRVVLRRAEPRVDARGPGVLATVDVAEALLTDPGATPGVLVRADGGDWQAIAADAGDGAPPGFHRFVARFGVAQQADLIAYAATPTAVRLFDHNRLPGDFDSFHLDAADGFSVAAAPAVCPGLPPAATLEFRGDFTERQHGAVVAGGTLVVDYDPARLTACRATHDGYRFWTLDAYARFTPGGQLASGSVVASNGPEVSPTPFVTDVPADATGVQLWFRNASPPSCEAWDSRYGQNYAFDVVAAPPPPIGWAGDLGGSTSRDCTHQDGLPDPIVLDEYARERACLFVDGDVWVGGVTDGAAPHPDWVEAQVEWQKDGGAIRHDWLDDAGRAGANERFRWPLPYELRRAADWNVVQYRLRFSTDGHTWWYPEDGARRSIERAFELPGTYF